MKLKLIFLSLIAYAINLNSINAQSCSSAILSYSGPKNTQELVEILNETSNPILTNLSVEMKTSLTNRMVFMQDKFKGFDFADKNIDKLNEQNMMQSVLEAILKMKVEVYSHEDRPELTAITEAEFYAKALGSNGNLNFRTVVVDCFNCDIPRGMQSCCHVPGGGCCDYAVQINDEYYKVTAEF